MLDTENCLQNRIKTAKATKFLSQPVFYTSKGSICEVFPSHDVWFKFYDFLSKISVWAKHLISRVYSFCLRIYISRSSITLGLGLCIRLYRYASQLVKRYDRFCGSYLMIDFQGIFNYQNRKLSAEQEEAVKKTR